MCGQHSKGQCTPAENGNVERVTEVDAQWATHPIPVRWARQCGDPCGASFVQYNPVTSSLNAYAAAAHPIPVYSVQSRTSPQEMRMRRDASSRDRMNFCPMCELALA